MRRFNHFRLRFGNLNGGFYDTGHFFNNWRANNRFDSGGDRDLSHHRLHMYFFLFALLFNLYILRTYNWIADPDFARGQFRRRARYGQRHWRLGWITLVTIATTTLTTYAQVTRRAARTTRHATVVTVISIVLFLLFWCSLRYDWQRDFHQFCAWSWRFLNNWFGSDSFFNHRCDYRFFGYALLVTHFLIELTLFTTRLNRTYTFFLFGFLNRLLFNIQRLRFLLRLTFIIITAAATFTTRRLLLVGGTRFFRYLSLLTALTRLGSLLLCLATITTVFFAIIAAFSTFTTGVAALITVTAVVLTRLATILLTFRFRFCFRCWLLGRFGFFTTAEQRFQCAEEAAQQPRLCRSGWCCRCRFRCWGYDRRGRFSWRWRWRHIRHGKGCQRRLFRTLTFSELFFRRQRHRFFMQLRQHVA